jgi:hypothetical protein
VFRVSNSPYREPDRRRDEDPRHTFLTGPDRVCARCGLDSDATFGLDERAALVCPVDRRGVAGVERLERAIRGAIFDKRDNGYIATYWVDVPKFARAVAARLTEPSA